MRQRTDAGIEDALALELLGLFAEEVLEGEVRRQLAEESTGARDREAGPDAPDQPADEQDQLMTEELRASAMRCDASTDRRERDDDEQDELRRSARHVKLRQRTGIVQVHFALAIFAAWSPFRNALAICSW